VNTLKDEMASVYKRGFGGALARLCLFYPNLDISILDPFKTMVNRALID